MQNRIDRQFICEVEKIEKEEAGAKKKIFKFIGSTSSKDRVGDVIDLDGWQTSNWEKNPVILWGHDSRGKLPIGKGLSVTKDIGKQALVFELEFASAIDPFAAMVEKFVENGFLKATSVGFKPLEYKYIKNDNPDSYFDSIHFIKQELLELSIVNVPMNPEALIVSNSSERLLMQRFGIDFETKESDETAVQILIFDKKEYKTVDDAKKWAGEREYKIDKIDDIEGFFKLHQHDLNGTHEDTLKTVQLVKGVVAVIGKLKDTSKFLNIDYVSGVTLAIKGLQDSIANTINENTKVLTQLNETTKGFSHLVELTYNNSEDNSPENPGKPPVGLAEKYLEEITGSLKSARELLEPKQ